MGLWRDFGRDLFRAITGRTEEARAITSLPWAAGGYMPSQESQGSALSLIAYFSCVRTLAEQISALPLQTYVDRGNIQLRIADSQLVTNPSVVVDPVTWMRQAIISLATKGNVVGFITSFDEMGFATGVEWIPWNEIYVDETNVMHPVYWWASAQGYFKIPRERVIHIAWFVEPGHVAGLSPIQLFAKSIGVGLAAQDYGATWFTSGGVPPATFKNIAKTITPAQVDEITDRLVQSLRAGRPLVHGNDWDFSAIQISPEESQFIETMKMNATQIAAIFGVPAEWVGGDTGGPLTYNTPELNGLYVYKNVLMPWIRLVETVLTRARPSTEVLKFNPDGILRADIKTRYEAHEIALRAGFLTVNEVRERENLPPLEGTDDTASTRELTEMIQKIYLGKDVVITWDEARKILNSAGAKLNLSIPDPSGMPAPPLNGARKDRHLPPLVDLIVP